MEITTFREFFDELSKRCKTRHDKRAALRLFAERVWFDGILTRTTLARDTGVSHPTVIRWCQIAEAMGCKPGQRRSRDEDKTAPTVESTERAFKAEAVRNAKPIGTAVDGTAYDDPKYDKSVDELRDITRRRATYDLINGTPDQFKSASDVLTKVLPNYRAPEVSVQVQAFLGSGAADNLLRSALENLPTIAANDESFIAELVNDPTVRKHLLAALPNAEIAEATDEPDEPASAARPTDDPDGDSA